MIATVVPQTLTFVGSNIPGIVFLHAFQEATAEAPSIDIGTISKELLGVQQEAQAEMKAANSLQVLNCLSIPCWQWRWIYQSSLKNSAPF